jgi:hypothetical protein
LLGRQRGEVQEAKKNYAQRTKLNGRTVKFMSILLQREEYIDEKKIVKKGYLLYNVAHAIVNHIIQTSKL